MSFTSMNSTVILSVYCYKYNGNGKIIGMDRFSRMSVLLYDGLKALKQKVRIICIEIYTLFCYNGGEKTQWRC